MLSALELSLCRFHQRSYCVLVSSGTIGLVLGIKALGLKGVRIAIPSGVCLNIPLAIKYAEAIPVYCDINPNTLSLTLETLSRVSGSFDAVLAVHSYGVACEVNIISEYCKSLGIPLIEDVAVAQGAVVESRPAGSFGELSILSFGRGKIIDVGAGGAVLTDDVWLARNIRQIHEQLPCRSDEDRERLSEFNLWHTQLYNQYYRKDRGPQEFRPFIQQAEVLRHSVLTKLTWNCEQVMSSLTCLQDNLKRRYKLTTYLFKKLKLYSEYIRCQYPTNGSVVWRACIFVPIYRDKILHELLAENFKISSWYPPAQDFLEINWSGARSPVSSQIGKEILNIWVNSEVDTCYLDHVVEKISQIVTSRVMAN